jgi:uncharacterized protein YlxW (UPF0749 family)
METHRQSKAPFLVSVVIAILLAAAFGFYYFTSTQTMNSLNSSISSQRGVINGQSSTIDSQSSDINSLQGSVSTLQANVTAYRTFVTSLKGLITTDSAKITDLTNKDATSNATVKADTAMIATLNSQITTAQALIANLTSTLDLQAARVLVNGQNVTIYGTTHSSSKPFTTFSPNYAGFVLVQVSAATEASFTNSTSKPSTSNTVNAVYESWEFLAPSSPTNVSYAIIPVVPGTLDSFALLSSTAVDGTATVTVTYVY